MSIATPIKMPGAASTRRPTAKSTSSEPAAAGPRAALLGGPTRDGCFSGGGPKREPTAVWALGDELSKPDDEGVSVLVADNLAIGGGGWHRYVFGAHAASGKVRWRIKATTNDYWIMSQACVEGGALYLGTCDGLCAFDLKTGKAKWKTRLPRVRGTPLAIGERCYIGGKKGVHAVEVAKGKKRWTFPLKDTAYSLIAFDEGTLYFYGDERLYALEASTGKKVLWKTAAVHGSDRAGPLVVGDRVVFLRDENVIAAVEKRTGKELWQQKLDDWKKHGSSFTAHGFAAADGTLVFKDGSGNLVALDVASGKLRWVSSWGAKKPFNIGHSGPVISDGVVYGITVDKPEEDAIRYLCALDLASGRLLWKLGPNSAGGDEWDWNCTPYLSDGVLYAQSSNRGIVALK